MKQKIYISGLITTILLVTGLFLKVNHFSGAAVAITLGIVSLLFLFLPFALSNNYKANSGKNPILYLVTWITCFVVFSSMLFKIMHWPFADIMLFISLPFPFVVFLPVFLIVTSKDKTFSIYNTMAVLFLLAAISVLSALLSLNVSKERIIDSYDLAKSYGRVEAVLSGIMESKPEKLPEGKLSQVVLNIEKLQVITRDYRAIILKGAGISEEQWENNPESLSRPEAVGLAAASLLQSGETIPGERMGKAIDELISSIAKSTGDQKLSAAFTEIFNYSADSQADIPWSFDNFAGSTLSWTLINLDALSADLLLLKSILNPLR